MARYDVSGKIDPASLYKDAAEERWAASMTGLLFDQYTDLRRELKKETRDPDPGWWASWETTYLAFMAPEFLNMAELAAQTSATRLGIGVDWNLVLSEAENWASTYAFGLVRDMNLSSEAALQNALQRFYAGQIDQQTLYDMLLPRFGPVRASNIASTEVTRGFQRGLDIYEHGLQQQGLVTDQVWWTEAGACPLCAANHGRYRDRDGWTISGTPAHPNCRCWTALVVVTSARRNLHAWALLAKQANLQPVAIHDH